MTSFTIILVFVFPIILNAQQCSSINVIVDGSSSKISLQKDVCLTAECIMAAGSILSTMNFQADPCDDFYKFACGSYELRQSIPAGKTRFGQLDIIDRIIKKNLYALLSEQTGQTGSEENSARQKAQIYYKSCMDTEKIANNSLPWLRRTIAKLGGFRLGKLPSDRQVPSDWTLGYLLKKRIKTSRNGPFSISVGRDDKNVLVNVLKLAQDGLGLGDNSRDYYVGKNLTSDQNLVAYTNLLQTYAEIALGKGETDRKLVVDVVEFEQKLAKIHRSQVEQQNAAAIYFKTDINWLQQNADFIDWPRHFNDVFKLVNITLQNDEPIILYNAPYFKDLNILMKEYLASENGKRTLQNYFIFRSVNSYLPYLGQEFETARDKFSEIFQGKKGSLDRWQICMSDTDSNVGFGLAAMYIDKYFPPEYKIQIETIVKDLVDSFGTVIKQVPWMDESTRASALDKLAMLAYDVAYPNWLKNETYLDNYYENLRVTDDYVANQVYSYIYAMKRGLNFLRQPPDPLRWGMTPPTVNAYYTRTQNKLAIPAGILNAPVFYRVMGIPMALNYGGIGSIAGHEISHGFDNNGRDYDKFGNLFDWWSNETRQQYTDRARCFVDKFDAYEVTGVHVRGKQTLNENIADDAGIKASYQAFVKARAEGRLGASSVVGLNLTDDQLFFLGWSQVWCSLMTEKMVVYALMQDAHSLAKFRIIGPLSNSPDFAKAFNCPAGSRMNPDKKCSVW